MEYDYLPDLNVNEVLEKLWLSKEVKTYIGIEKVDFIVVKSNRKFALNVFRWSKSFVYTMESKEEIIEVWFCICVLESVEISNPCVWFCHE